MYFYDMWLMHLLIDEIDEPKSEKKKKYSWIQEIKLRSSKIFPEIRLSYDLIQGRSHGGCERTTEDGGGVQKGW